MESYPFGEENNGEDRIIVTRVRLYLPASRNNAIDRVASEMLFLPSVRCAAPLVITRSAAAPAAMSGRVTSAYQRAGSVVDCGTDANIGSATTEVAA